MAGFEDIIGHEKIIEHLVNSISLGKVSHAYILNGPKESGKMMIAEAFARALQCENNDPRGCGQCKSCKQAEDRNQPDIIYVSHEKDNLIGVKEIREKINGDMPIKPYSSKYKIYIVDDAELMNAQSQNALLKTIEEPPAYGIIILLTTNADNFLQTIRSRCIILDIKAIKDEIIKDYLIKEHQVPDYEAEVRASFAQGNVGKAILLCNSNDFSEMKESMLNVVKEIENTEIYQLSAVVKSVAEFKTKIQDYFDLLNVWYRDILYYKATNDTKALIFKDQAYEIKKQSAKHSFSGIELILEGIDQARVRLGANVNFDLVIELLLLTMKEN